MSNPRFFLERLTPEEEERFAASVQSVMPELQTLFAQQPNFRALQMQNDPMHPLAIRLDPTVAMNDRPCPHNDDDQTDQEIAALCPSRVQGK